jgi:hypothetical protein
MHSLLLSGLSCALWHHVVLLEVCRPITMLGNHAAAAPYAKTVHCIFSCTPTPTLHPVLLQTLSNLGDALVSQGEAALQLNQPDAGQAAFASALECYQASCSLSDSSAGDDLPGLLHNWGVGLHTISKQAQVGLSPHTLHGLNESDA